MKRTFKVPFLASIRNSTGAAAFALGTIVLFGCPIYSGSQTQVTCDDEGNCCDQYENCGTWACDTNSQCPAGSVCSQSYAGYGQGGGGYCTAPYDAGDEYDASYDAGVDADSTAPGCPSTPCPTGQTCTLSNGVASCVATPDTGSPDTGTPDVTVSNPDTGAPDVQTTTPDAGTPDSGHDSGQVFPPFGGCINNSQCSDSGAGAQCLDGVCVSAANQCFDSTQCPSLGGNPEQCVNGVCTPSCSSTISCPTGFSCDLGTGVCSGNSAPCGAADDGGTCGAGLTCVQEHCVPICTTGDAGGDAGSTCSAGLECVDHGCIPNQTPTFVCAGDDGTQSTCASGSICLHHNCYISCNPDASTDASGSCRTAENFNQCKAVTDSNGTFHVCSSESNLGDQCGPTGAGQTCMTPAVCIDGFCR